MFLDGTHLIPDESQKFRDIIAVCFTVTLVYCCVDDFLPASGFILCSTEYRVSTHIQTLGQLVVASFALFCWDVIASSLWTKYSRYLLMVYG